MSEPVDMSYWYERCMKAEQERDQLKAERDEAQRQRDILLKHDSEKVAALKAELARIRDSACSVCGYPRQKHGDGLGLTEEEADSYIPCEYCFLKRELDRIREAEGELELLDELLTEGIAWWKQGAPNEPGGFTEEGMKKFVNALIDSIEIRSRQLRQTRAALAVAQQTNKKLQEYTVHGKHCDGNHCECRLEQLEQLTGEAR